MSMESIYEYGSRAGFWRLWRMFTERDMPVTVFGVATALSATRKPSPPCRKPIGRSPATASNGSTTRTFGREEERAHLNEAIRIHTRGRPASGPLGWYTGRTSEHTNRLVAEEGGFLYSADSYADELPYWEHTARQQLVVPYTLDANDMRFATPQGFNSGDQFFAYLKDSFDTLYAEGETRAEDAVGRPALPARRPSRARRGTGAVPGLRSVARTGLGGAAHRHRTALAIASSPGGVAPKHHEPRRIRRPLRRCLRAFAVDRRASSRCAD